jgi:hypothetical protein
MVVNRYEDVAAFLQKTQAYLEQNEALSGIMPGLAFRLAQFAGQIKGDSNDYLFMTAGSP